MDDLNDDVEFFCPTCIPEKEKEFVSIKERLRKGIEELATRQNELGGVTIDRDMFKDKKNANSYNYSKDFPPTLRDLGIRVTGSHKTISDFKSDYKLMCSKMTEYLKDDYESQIQMVEWEIDDLVVEVLKPEPENTDNQTSDNEDDFGQAEESVTEAAEEETVDPGELIEMTMKAILIMEVCVRTVILGSVHQSSTIV